MRNGPCATEVEAGVTKGRLENAVALWPTPVATDFKTVSSEGQRRGQPSGAFPGAKLNPDWVEWLMGWPVGWTSLEPLSEVVWPGWSSEPVERTTTKREARRYRLKALGNGQVPQCAVRAWWVLSQ